MRKVATKLKSVILWQSVAIAILIAVIIVELCILIVDIPKKALKESNFKNMEVTIHKQISVLDGEEEEDDEVLDTEDTDSEEVESDNEETTRYGTVTVADGIQYSEADTYKTYLVTEEGTDYAVCFVEDALTDDDNEGHWEKYQIESVSEGQLFDFSSIMGLTKKDFEKSGEYYILKENANEKLCEILQTTQTGKYICDYLNFYFENNRLISIDMGYYYVDDMYVTYEFDFNYGGYELKLPEIRG